MLLRPYGAGNRQVVGRRGGEGAGELTFTWDRVAKHEGQVTEDRAGEETASLWRYHMYCGYPGRIPGLQ